MKKKYRKIAVLIFSIILLSLTACNSKKDNDQVLTFVGESQSWHGTFTQVSFEVWQKDENNKISHASSSNDQFILRYKGNDDIDSVGAFKYSYSSNPKSGSGTSTLKQDGVFSASDEGSNGALLRENHIITVTVEWNDSKETFEMNSNK